MDSGIHSWWQYRGWRNSWSQERDLWVCVHCAQRRRFFPCSSSVWPAYQGKPLQTDCQQGLRDGGGWRQQGDPRTQSFVYVKPMESTVFCLKSYPNVHLSDYSLASTSAVSRCHLPPPQQQILQPMPPRPQAPLMVRRDEGSHQARRRKDLREPAVLWALLGAKPRIPLKTTSSSGLVRRANKRGQRTQTSHLIIIAIWTSAARFMFPDYRLWKPLELFLSKCTLQSFIDLFALFQELKEGIRGSSLTFREWLPPLLARFWLLTATTSASR